MFDVIPVTSERQTDCGPTCLKMLLAFYGIDVELEILIEECNTRLIGCTMRDLKRVGEAHGLSEVGFWNMDAEELVRQDRPAIVWWCYGHFVVFCGKNEKGDIVICNPDRGRFAIDFGTFKTRFVSINHPGMGTAMFVGEPHDLPEDETATAADYEAALGELGVKV